MEPPELPTAAQLREFVVHIDHSLDQFRTEMREGFARVEIRFNQVDTRLTHIDTRLDQLDMRLNHLDSRFLQLDSRLGRLEPGGLPPPLLLVWLTAGVALAVSLFALWR